MCIEIKENNNKGICKFTVIITFLLQPIIIRCWLQLVSVFTSGLPAAGMFTEALILTFLAFHKNILGASRISLVCAIFHSYE